MVFQLFAVLCLLSMALWIRNQFFAYDKWLAVDQREWSLLAESVEGRLVAYVRSYPEVMPPHTRLWSQPVDDSGSSSYRQRTPWFQRHVFHLERYETEIGSNPEAWWVITIGSGPLTAALAIVPLAALYRRLHRPRRGCCAHCGYDLRGGHERCPECGAPVPTPAAKVAPSVNITAD